MDDEQWKRELAIRERLLAYVARSIDDHIVRTATDAYSDLLVDAYDEMLVELLRPVFRLSSLWPKYIAAECLGVDLSDEGIDADALEFEELLRMFEERGG